MMLLNLHYLVVPGLWFTDSYYCLLFIHLTVSKKVTADAVNNGTLDQGGQARWEYPVPQSGLAFKIDVTLGRVVFYASSDTTAPNEAIYQWKIEVSFGSRTINILPVLQSDGVTRSSTANQTIIPIYTAIVGLEAKNVFSLSTSGK